MLLLGMCLGPGLLLLVRLGLRRELQGLSMEGRGRARAGLLAATLLLLLLPGMLLGSLRHRGLARMGGGPAGGLDLRLEPPAPAPLKRVQLREVVHLAVRGWGQAFWGNGVVKAHGHSV